MMRKGRAGAACPAQTNAVVVVVVVERGEELPGRDL